MSDSNPQTSRRRVIKACAGAGGIAVLTQPTSAQDDPYDGWFDDVPNYEGTLDFRGTDLVEVSVGAGDTGFLFDPPAIQIDPGTTVVWEWTGEGGAHNVVEENGVFESELVDEAGHVFEHTFTEGDEDEIYRYSCLPHEALGMRGAVAVGDVVEVIDEGVQLSFDPVEDEVAPGETVTYELIVEGATEGVGAYDITAGIGDTDVATISDAELVEFGGDFTDIEIAEDGSSVSLQEAVPDGGQADPTFTLAEVTMTAEGEGTTQLTIDDDSILEDADGNEYKLQYQSATVVVEPDDGDGGDGDDDRDVQLLFDPAEGAVTPEGTITYELIVEGATEGINAYNFTAEIGATDVATITDAELIEFGGQFADIEIADDGSDVFFEEAVGDQDPADPTFTIAKLIVEAGEDEGTTQLEFIDAELQDNDANEYELDLQPAAVAVVEEVAPDVTGDGNPAQDLTGDGLYEDVDGDGEADIFDVQALFDNRDTEAVQDNVELFDFNNNGDVDIFDVQALFDRI